MYARLLALALFASSAAAVPNRTPAELDCTNLPNGVYPNHFDCSTFYKCSNGYTYLYECPANLLFDEPTLQCEWPELARCAGDDCSKHKAGELHGVIGCHGHAYGDLYPDPYDCASFYQCAHGAGGTIEAHHFNCPASPVAPFVLHFNDELKVCDWPENAGCKSCGPSPTEAPPTTTTQAPTEAPTTTQAPTDAPTTPRPTRPPTRPTTQRPTTQRPTRPPTTQRPTTQRPTTQQPTTQQPTTQRPTTQRPTRPPTRPTTQRPTHPTDAPTTTEAVTAAPTTTRKPRPTFPTLPPFPTFPTFPPFPTFPTFPPFPTFPTRPTRSPHARQN